MFGRKKAASKASVEAAKEATSSAKAATRNNASKASSSASKATKMSGAKACSGKKSGSAKSCKQLNPTKNPRDAWIFYYCHIGFKFLLVPLLFAQKMAANRRDMARTAEQAFLCESE